MEIYENCVEKAGLDQKRIKSITNRFQKIANEAGKMGVEIFGGSGFGQLRYDDHDPSGRQLIIADITGFFSGGDGHSMEDDSGYLRGE